MIAIEPWGPGDLPLLRAILGDPRMTEHLGGPEDEESLRARHERYLRISTEGPGGALKIVADGTAVGWVGYWDLEWQGEDVFELGWSVVVEHQGRGYAKEGTRLALAEAAATRRHRWAHAFPTPDNLASNAVCRALGFELLGPVDFEYKGVVDTSNDWRLDLEVLAPANGFR